MRIGPVVGVVLVLLSLAAPALAAGPEFYLLGGVALANLGGDAELLGNAFAAELDIQAGGSWQSTKKSRMGMDVGGGMRYGRSDVIGGAVELRYATRGVKYDLREVSGSGVSATETLKLNYVEMPVLLEWTPAVSGSVQPLFVAGPVFALKASAKATTQALGQSDTQDFPSGTIKSAAFGGLVGAGIKIKAASSSSILLQARFQRPPDGKARMPAEARPHRHARQQLQHQRGEILRRDRRQAAEGLQRVVYEIRQGLARFAAP